MKMRQGYLGCMFLAAQVFVYVEEGLFMDTAYNLLISCRSNGLN